MVTAPGTKLYCVTSGVAELSTRNSSGGYGGMITPSVRVAGVRHVKRYAAKQHILIWIRAHDDL